MPNISAALGSIVVGVVVLFVGVYMISAVADVVPLTSIYDTNTAENTTVLTQLGTNISVHNITVSDLINIGGQFESLDVWISEESCATGTGTIIEVLQEGAYIANLTVPATSSTQTIEDLAFVEGVNNITYISWCSVQNVSYINASTITYYDDTTYTTTGTWFNDMVALTGTAFSVFGLVLIIVGLAFAIRSLQGFTD